MIVIPFHPHHLNSVAWVGELSNVPKEFPMLFGKAAKIQVSKDIAQQNKSLEMNRLKKSKGCTCLADLRAQVQIGDNYRVKAISLHAPYL
jgi:hypothetical protein